MDEAAGQGSLDDPASREATAAFLMRLRRAGVRDLAVLRAIEATPRHLFTPRRFRDLAFRDMSLPLPCGQSMPHALAVARLAEAAACAPHLRLLEVGAGSGYCTAVFARLCAEVVSLERYRSLVVEARARLEALGLTNASVGWGDGAEPPPAAGKFDRIVVHALATAQDVARLAQALAPGGAILTGERGEGDAPAIRLVRHVASAGLGAPLVRTALGATRLRPLERGLARAL